MRLVGVYKKIKKEKQKDQQGSRLLKLFHSPHYSIGGYTDEWSVTKVILSQMSECIVDGAKGEGEAPLKSAFHVTMLLRIQEHCQTGAAE